MIQILQPHSLTVRDRFTPETMRLDLSERQSTATLTVGPDAPLIGVGDWLRDEKDPGAGIVWRVKTVDQQYDTDTRSIQLEHAINLLKDVLMFGEVKPSTMGGGDTIGAAAAARWILGRQSDWRLGAFEYSTAKPYNFNGENLFAALETISSSLEDALWDYDFAAYPFTLNIRRAGTAVGCEMRLSRNIRTLKRTVDRSRMYTRFYPIGKDNLHITGEYVTKNEALYGTISKTETDQSIDTEAKLRAWANERLNRHCNPSVTITISGLELSRDTGEPMDRIRVGTVCQVPLPEFSTTLTERVTKLSWSDKIHDPQSVTVTLANQLEDVASIVNNITQSAGRSGRASAKDNEEKHAWIIDENDKVGLLAEAVAGPGAATDWSRVASIIVDGEGIHQRVTRTENDMVVAEAAIEVSEKQINQFVKAVGADGQITAASIVLAINDAGESEARIDANKVYIGNQKSTTVINGKCSLSDVTAEVIKGRIATLSSLFCPQFEGNIYGSTVMFASGTTPYGTTTYTNVKAAIAAVQIAASGQNYKLQYKTFNDTSWIDAGTFNRAVTALDGVWSDGAITVTPSGLSSPTYVDHLTGGTPYTDPNDDYRYKVNVLHYLTDPTRPSGTGLTIDIESVYQAGYEVTQAQITTSNFSTNYTGSVSGKTQIGSFSKSSLSGNSYILLSVKCHGTTKQFYITVNN